MLTKVCEGGAGLHPQGGAEGGAKVAVCEGNSQGSQPKDRASSVSPRYRIECSTKLYGTTEVPEKSGAFVVSAVRAGRSKMSSRLINGVTPSVPRILTKTDIPRVVAWHAIVGSLAI